MTDTTKTPNAFTGLCAHAGCTGENCSQEPRANQPSERRPTCDGKDCDYDYCTADKEPGERSQADEWRTFARSLERQRDQQIEDLRRVGRERDEALAKLDKADERVKRAATP